MIPVTVPSTAGIMDQWSTTVIALATQIAFRMLPLVTSLADEA